MDKIKIGDVLKNGDIKITITEIYLYQMHKGDDFKPSIVYKWYDPHDPVWGDGLDDMETIDTNWEEWEKV